MSKEIGTLVVVVLKAKNLPDKHSLYKQDVFAQVNIDGKIKKTKVDVRGGQHPLWDEELRFPIYQSSSPKDKTLEVNCWRKESREEELIGKGIVDISETLRTGEFDDWVKLEVGNSYCGEVYLEMTFFAAGPAPLQRRPSKMPNSERLARSSQPYIYSSSSPSVPPKTPPKSHSPTRHPPVESASNSQHRLSAGPMQPHVTTTHLAPPSPPHTSPRMSPRSRYDALPPIPQDTLSPANIPEVLRPGNPKSDVHYNEHGHVTDAHIHSRLSTSPPPHGRCSPQSARPTSQYSVSPVTQISPHTSPPPSHGVLVPVHPSSQSESLPHGGHVQSSPGRGQHVGSLPPAGYVQHPNNSAQPLTGPMSFPTAAPARSPSPQAHAASASVRPATDSYRAPSPRDSFYDPIASLPTHGQYPIENTAYVHRAASQSPPPSTGYPTGHSAVSPHISYSYSGSSSVRPGSEHNHPSVPPGSYLQYKPAIEQPSYHQAPASHRAQSPPHAVSPPRGSTPQAYVAPLSVSPKPHQRPPSPGTHREARSPVVNLIPPESPLHTHYPGSPPRSPSPPLPPLPPGAELPPRSPYTSPAFRPSQIQSQHQSRPYPYNYRAESAPEREAVFSMPVPEQPPPYTESAMPERYLHPLPLPDEPEGVHTPTPAHPQPYIAPSDSRHPSHLPYSHHLRSNETKGQKHEREARDALLALELEREDERKRKEAEERERRDEELARKLDFELNLERDVREEDVRKVEEEVLGDRKEEEDGEDVLGPRYDSLGANVAPPRTHMPGGW